MGICLHSKGYPLPTSLAKFPKPQLPPRLQGLYPSRLRGRLLCNMMCGCPKGSHPTNYPSFKMTLAFFLVFCTCGVYERNPWRGATQDCRPYSWQVSLTGNWALASISWMGLGWIWVPASWEQGTEGQLYGWGYVWKNCLGILYCAWKLLCNSRETLKNK